MQHLDIVDITAAYGSTPVLNKISLGVDQGQIISLIGPSGSGKSTLLRVLVGLLRPSEGHVSFSGKKIDYSSDANVREIRNRFAIVFQQFNLFQNMTAIDNVTIAPIKIKKRNKREAMEEGEALLSKVGLADKMKSYPDELSGGQQQRVAIARALALKPELLLLDEITASLDPELVSGVLETIESLANEGMTMMIASHEMGFVREVSSRVAFMDVGRIVELGRPEDVFDNPKEPRTKDFVRTILRT